MWARIKHPFPLIGQPNIKPCVISSSAAENSPAATVLCILNAFIATIFHHFLIKQSEMANE